MIDPGPGSLVRCAASKPKLDPLTLDAIILTHRHLDHSGDINVMIEAMTEGGFKKRGVVFCPGDTVNKDTVILEYAKKFPQAIKILKPLTSYRVGNFRFKTSMRHIHPVETYGFKFNINGVKVSLLTDTKYFKQLQEFYNSDILVLYVVFCQDRPNIEHLSLIDAEKLIREIRPKKVILTHFGMSMLRARPNLQAKILSARLGIEVSAAYDGMMLKF